MQYRADTMKRIDYLLLVLLLAVCSCGREAEPPTQKNFLTLGFTDKKVESSENTFSLTVESNCEWTVDNTAEWIDIAPSSSSYSQSAFLTIRIKENKGTQERSAQIAFHYKDEEEDVFLTITQEGFKPIISISDADLSFGYRSAEKIIGISSNCGWYAKTDCDWVAIRPVTGLIGLFDMNIFVETNLTTTPRNTSIHIINDTYGLDSVIEINQAAQTTVNNKSYIDEYGIDWGQGITILGLAWAPVNCGYHKEEHPYGKLFQWGRKYGLAYKDNPTGALWDGENGSEDQSTFYFPGDGSIFGYDWIRKGSNQFWNTGTEEYPVKNTSLDPCPDGWRVPTAFEFRTLTEHCSHTGWESSEYGYSFTDDENTKVFLIAGGRLNTADGIPYDRDIEGFYWTCTTLSGNPAYLYFNKENCQINEQGSKAGACLVRCVKE